MTSNVDAFEYANRSTPLTKRVIKQMLAAGQHCLGRLQEVQCWYKPARSSPVRACLTLHTMYKSIPEVRGKC